MAEQKQTEEEFGKGDIVKLQKLKGKAQWNGMLATIIGEKVEDKNRWPIQLNSGDKSKALLQSKNLKLYEKAEIFINIVEMKGSGFSENGPLESKLRNKSFKKSELKKYIKNGNFSEYKSQFAEQLGYNISIYIDPQTPDHLDNAPAVYLTSSLHNGMSPYNRKFKGNAFVVCNDDNKILTSDRLWGICFFIWECQDYFNGKIKFDYEQERGNRIFKDVKKYKKGKWKPRHPKGTRGIDIYCDQVKHCQMNSFDAY
eukprot:251102_1